MAAAHHPHDAVALAHEAHDPTVGDHLGPGLDARGNSVRLIVCFTARPPGSYRNTRENSTARQPSFVEPRSSTAEDAGGGPGSCETVIASSTRSA